MDLGKIIDKVEQGRRKEIEETLEAAGRCRCTEYPPRGPEISGKPDDTPFDRCELRQVVYMIDLVLEEMRESLHNHGAINKLERRIAGLPGELTTQRQAFDWLVEHYHA